MTFQLTDAAKTDLSEILEYVALANGIERAEALLEDLIGAFDRLARMPHIGHARTDITDEDVRFWIVHRYLVVYSATMRPLPILRVVHGARDRDALDAMDPRA